LAISNIFFTISGGDGTNGVISIKFSDFYLFFRDIEAP